VRRDDNKIPFVLLDDNIPCLLLDDNIPHRRSEQGCMQGMQERTLPVRNDSTHRPRSSQALRRRTTGRAHRGCTAGSERSRG
jgi:hypothetical protein